MSTPDCHQPVCTKSDPLKAYQNYGNRKRNISFDDADDKYETEEA